MLDNDVLEEFRQRADKEGLGYQTLINQTLRARINARPLEEDTLYVEISIDSMYDRM